MGVCRLCEKTLGGKILEGVKKWKLDTRIPRHRNVSVYAALQLLFSYEGANDGYLCNDCYLKTHRGYVAYAGMSSSEFEELETPSKKRKLTGASPESNQPKATSSAGNNQNTSNETNICDTNDNVTPETSLTAMQVCRMCEKNFKRRKVDGQLDKIDMQSRIRNHGVRIYAGLQLLFSYEGPRDGYLCGVCYQKLVRDYSAYASRGSKKTQSLAEIADKVEASMMNGRYYTAIRRILSASVNTEKAYMQILQRKIKKEIKSFNEYPTLENISSIEGFNWNKLVDDMRVHMPCLTGAVEAAMPSIEENNRSMVLQRLCFMMSIPLYSLKPNKFNFLQALVGVQMWRDCCNEKLFKVLNKMGICQGASAIRRHINKLCQEQKKNEQQQKVGATFSTADVIESVHSNEEELQSVNSNANEPQPSTSEVYVCSTTNEPQPSTSKVYVCSTTNEPQPSTSKVSVCSATKEAQPSTNKVTVCLATKEADPPTSKVSVCSATKEPQSTARNMPHIT